MRQGRACAYARDSGTNAGTHLVGRCVCVCVSICALEDACIHVHISVTAYVNGNIPHFFTCICLSDITLCVQVHLFFGASSCTDGHTNRTKLNYARSEASECTFIYVCVQHCKYVCTHRCTNVFMYMCISVHARMKPYSR